MSSDKLKFEGLMEFVRLEERDKKIVAELTMIMELSETEFVKASIENYIENLLNNPDQIIAGRVKKLQKKFYAGMNKATELKDEKA